MIRQSEKLQDLNESQDVWLRPRERFYGTLDLGRDISAATFRLFYREKEWSYLPANYDILEEGEYDLNQVGALDLSNSADGVIMIVVPTTVLVAWENRTVELQLQVTEGDAVWVAVDFTITVSHD